MRPTALALLLLVTACQDSSSLREAGAPAAGAPDAAAKAAEAVEKDEAKPNIGIESPNVPKDTWMAFSSDEGGYAVRFPSAPSSQVADVPTPVGDIKFTTHMASGDGNVQFGAMYGDFPADMMKDFDLDKGLDGARNGAITNIGGTLLSEQQITFAGQKARAFQATASASGLDFALDARVFMVGARLYQLIVVYPASAQGVDASKFFDSFELTP